MYIFRKIVLVPVSMPIPLLQVLFIYTYTIFKKGIKVLVPNLLSLNEIFAFVKKVYSIITVIKIVNNLP